MARLVLAGALCALAFGFQAVLTQTTDISLPPEDLDSSGDDDDSFSGSGAGSLLEHPVIPRTVALQGSTNASISVVSAHVPSQQPEVQTADSPIEDNERVPVSPTSTPVLQTSDLVTDKPAVPIGDEMGSLAEQATTRSAVVTTKIPVTHHISTVRITTSQASSTVRVAEPEIHPDHPYLSNSDKEVTIHTVSTSETSLDAPSPTTSITILHNDIFSPLPEEDILSPEDGSGDQGDFTFNLLDDKIEAKGSEPENRAGDTGTHDAKSAGIMDRKEVLGGVIAGGFVGLLFAGFLVGFMLYRMKKKDEGSYSLDEPKQSNGGYQKPHKQEEFYA